MSTNSTPEILGEYESIERLPIPAVGHIADQAREMGLNVGDVIVGRDCGGDAKNGWWREERLTLKYIGERCCVWDVEWRNKALTVFRSEGESSAWTLNLRDWYRITFKSDKTKI